jgi:pilus assembly protein CpaF
MNDPSIALPFIENLLEDPQISEIMIDGWQRVYVDKEERLADIPTPFGNDDQVRELLNTIAQLAGTPIDEKTPIASFRLSDDTYIEAVLPPVALGGPCLTITKPPTREITLDDFLAGGCITPKATDYLKACVEGRLNIAISGGISSGKTQLLRIMSQWIPPAERILFLQDTGRRNMPHKRLVILETRPPDRDGKNAVTMQDLVQTAMRMRPDRMIVAEVRGAEMFDLLNAMNHGYDGSLFTIQANGPRDALTCMECMAGLANPEIPLLALREQIASAIDIVVQQERLRDGTRKITHISEVSGMENGVITMTDIFLFNQRGISNGRVVGSLLTTGLIPKSLGALENAGVHVPISMFSFAQE